MSNRNYLAVTALYHLMGITAGTLGSLMVLVQRSTGATLSQIGLIVTLFSFGSLAGIALFNKVSTKIAAGKIIPLGFGILALGYFAVIHTNNFAQSMMWSFLLGVGFGVLDLGLAQIVTRSKNTSAVKTNISNAIFGLGGVVGAVVVALFGVHSLGNLFYLIVTVGLVASFLLKDNLWQAQFQSKKRIDFSPKRIVLPTLLATGIYVALELSAASWLPSLIEARENNGEKGAAATALFYGLFTAGRFIGAYLSRWLSAAQLIEGALLLTVIPMAIAVVSDNPSYFLIALTGLSLGPVFANTMTFIVSATPENHGASALLLYASMSGSLVIFPVIGFAIDISEVTIFPIILITLSLLSFTFYRIAFAAKEKIHDEN